MELFHRTVDYAEVCNNLKKVFGPEKEAGDYFSLFEHCQDTQLLDDCKTLLEVNGEVVREYELYGMDRVFGPYIEPNKG